MCAVMVTDHCIGQGNDAQKLDLKTGMAFKPAHLMKVQLLILLSVPKSGGNYFKWRHLTKLDDNKHLVFVQAFPNLRLNFFSDSDCDGTMAVVV